MTAERLAGASIIRTSLFVSPVAAHVADNGNNVLEGLRVFRHGTFKDSMGFERTWEPLHLDEMVMYHNHLKEAGIFANVPVRTDHSFSVKDVVGYLTDVYRDKQDDSFLSVDIEFTEPDAYEKWQRGTLRSRSLEVGMYETNDGASYYPVVMGLAFVDIPAVEGLHGKEKSNGTVYFSQARTIEQENNRMNLEEFLAACRYAEWETAATYAQAVADWEKAANYALALEQHAQHAQALGITATHSAPPANPPQGGGNYTFQIGGQPVSDFGQVQRELSTLEAFQRETIKANRENFITSLAERNIILAPQAEHLKGLVETMSVDQFKKFQEAYQGEGAPATLLQNHGAPAGSQPPAAATTAEQMSIQEEVVHRLKDSGMTDEQIQKTAAFQKLQSLKTGQNG